MVKTDEFNGCGNCTKLKWNRKRLGLTQKQFGDKVGLSVMTINKLEKDETAWSTLQDSIVDKIMSFYSSMASWQPERADKVVREINESVKEPIEEPVEDVTDVETNTMNKCEMLVSSRRKLGMSQTEFSVKSGVAEKTLRRLEKDESAWETVRESTIDKIMNFISGTSSYQPEKSHKVLRKTNKTVKASKVKEEVIMKPEPVIEKIQPVKIVDELHNQDIKTLTLIEFAYEELTQAKTHTDFELAIKMIKKIADKY